MQNTKKDTQWALNTYEGFRAAQLAQPDNPHAANFAKPLTEQTEKELIISMGAFILGVKKKKPSSLPSNVADPYAYPGSTLQQLLRGIDRHLRESIDAENALKLVDGLPPKDQPGLLTKPAFKPLRSALDRRILSVTGLGIGIVKTQADDLTEEREQVISKVPLTSDSFLMIPFKAGGKGSPRYIEFDYWFNSLLLRIN